ncbi:30S ribosomal protein S2 [Candidatus Cytomitobacter indipagum]|uniref:Small ribosomal subunit protein uS2 n=1 Tax=Candidatus Cytomitobacter indipagum TaxID=2601575 RepID=A0A5C0UG11_9PROT|nr:30S ribosomal protein S2 [Candidatus Cytomitobacter indipagum]QEK38202.1 30S ribosomal protein S2 [Candidatus Cytomitobacter indipagum]
MNKVIDEQSIKDVNSKHGGADIESEIVASQEQDAKDVNEKQKSDSDIESIIKFSFRDLQDAGLQFGHKVARTNRRMLPYIYGEKDGIHLINLGKTIPLLKNALLAVRKHASNPRNGRILFVGTKHQSSEAVQEAAMQCAQYYVNKKWLGGLLTNWNTVSKSIKRMKDIEKKIKEGYFSTYKKHEQVKIQKNYEKDKSLFEGIRDMSDLPSLIIITSHHEQTAIKEAQVLNIPIILLLDTNGDPKGISYPVPGNDDSIISVHLFCALCSRAGLLGIHDEQEILKRKEEEKKEKEKEKEKND